MDCRKSGLDSADIGIWLTESFGNQQLLEASQIIH